MKALDEYLARTIINGDCLEWQGALNSDGYPRAGVKGNYNLKVHREVFFLVNGFYPEVVRHKCDNIICINPDHLEPGNQLDNVNDRVQRGRTHNHVPDELLEQVVSLKKSGMKLKDIATTIGQPYKRIDYILYQSRKVKG